MKESTAFHKYLQFKFVEYVNSGNEVDITIIGDLLGKYNLPRELLDIILKEMEDMGLVKQVKYDKCVRVRIINCPLKDMGKFHPITRRKYYIQQIKATISV